MNKDTTYEQKCQYVSDLITAMTCSTRIRIIDLIKTSELRPRDIADCLNLDRAVVGFHLKFLLNFGAVRKSAKGRGVYYILDMDTYNNFVECITFVHSKFYVPEIIT